MTVSESLSFALIGDVSSHRVSPAHVAVPASGRITRTVTVARQPSPNVSSGDSHSTSDLILGLLLSGAFLAALVNIALTRRKSLEEERTRVRASCAEAFQTVAEYEEFPYAIRRRRADVPAEERIRLSEELRRIQARLSYYIAWMHAEDPKLAGAFDDLVTNLRRLAGEACHEAWLAPAADSDAAMNVASELVDLSALAPHEDVFVAAVEAHLDSLIKTRRILSWRRR